MSNASVTVLWVYVVLLLVGGIMGFVKAKSKVSLVTSAVSAVLLALCALGVFNMTVAEVLTALLAVVFVIRYAKTKKFMPAGLMIVLSAAALAGMFLLR